MNIIKHNKFKKDKVEPLLRCFRMTMRLSIVASSICLALPLVNYANAVVNTSKNTIRGAAPKLSTALEQQIINQNFSRFEFTYDGVAYNDSNLSSLPQIKDPDTLKPSDILAKIKPKLNSVFQEGTANDDAVDANKDGTFSLIGINGAGLPIAETALTVKIVDKNNVEVTDAGGTFCNLNNNSHPWPYKVEISSDLRLLTKYGDPRSKDYIATTTETNGIQPLKRYELPIKGICEIQTLDTSGKAGGDSTWTGKGFKVVSKTGSSGENPALNFPTVGYHGAIFYISVLGVDAGTLTYPAAFKQGTMKVTITGASANLIQVQFAGPNFGFSQNPTAKDDTTLVRAAFSPPGVVEIKDTANTISYKFNVKRWWVPRARWNASSSVVLNKTYLMTDSYCKLGIAGGAGVPDNQSLVGKGYRVPTIEDYTSNRTTDEPGLLPGVTGTKINIRAIGKGVFPEWGATSDHFASDWAMGQVPYWSSTPNVDTTYPTYVYTVNSGEGTFLLKDKSAISTFVACVSDN